VNLEAALRMSQADGSVSREAFCSESTA
jgi:hypothetical protein